MSELATRLRNAVGKMVMTKNAFDELAPQGGGPTYSMDVHQVKEYLNTSHPVWGPEIGTHSGLSEGYSSITFKRPWVSFAEQATYLQEDEDVQLAVNHLSSDITGNDHYWKAKKKEYSDYMSKFTKKIWFDILDTEIVKELLWYGNTVLVPLIPIPEIQHRHDLLHIPISSFIRIWIDRLRRPYKYEFRGSEWQGYMNPQDIIHLKYNPVNANPFGTGFGVALASQREFFDISVDGLQARKLPNLIDRKLATSFWMHLAQKRYISRNVYQTMKSTKDDRATLKSHLKKLEPGEDIVTGVKLTVQELGTSQRNFDPTLFSNLVSGQLYKGLGDFTGKQGEESSHQYANAKESSKEVEKSLASFPLAVTLQLIEYLFEPWYKAHPLYDPEYGMGMVSLPWDECGFELNFGQEVKRDLTPEQHFALLQLIITSGLIKDPSHLLELFEDSGLAIRSEIKESIDTMYNDPNGQLALANVGQSPIPDWSSYAADMAQRPMDMTNQYTPSSTHPTPRFVYGRYDPKIGTPQTSPPYLNFGPLAGEPVQYTKKEIKEMVEQKMVVEHLKVREENDDRQERKDMRKKILETIEKIENSNA